MIIALVLLVVLLFRLCLSRREGMWYIAYHGVSCDCMVYVE